MQPLRIDLARAALDENYILLLTTNSAERRAMNAVLKTALSGKLPFDSEGCTLSQIGDRFVLHVTGTSGAHKDKSVDRIVRSLLADRQMPRPQFVLLAGFAWGNPNSTQTGDVILSDEVVSVSESRRAAGTTLYRDTPYRSPLFGHAVPLSEMIRGAVPEVEVRAGRLASAPTHYGDGEALDELLRQVPSVLGGEMEAFALVPGLDHPWLVLRCVSDFGENDVDRSFQKQAAFNVSAVVGPLVVALERDAILPPPRADEFTEGLAATLAGRSLKIARPDAAVDLIDYLNLKVGPTLDYRLRQYMVMAPDDVDLANELTALLLEKAQNAFRHGHAECVTVSFNDLSVDYDDDGAVYDLFALEGRRGGAVALNAFRDDFVTPGLVKISERKPPETFRNAYRFEFISVSKALHAARTNCRLTIDEVAVRRGEAFERQVSFPPACETLFYDFSATRMISILVDMVPVLRELLSQGKSLFLLVRGESDKRFYETELADYLGGQLTIVVDRR